MENPLTSSHFYFSCVEFSNKGQVILGLCILKQIKGSKTEMEEEKEERGKEGWREERREDEGRKGRREGKKGWNRALFCNIWQEFWFAQKWPPGVIDGLDWTFYIINIQKPSCSHKLNAISCVGVTDHW